MTTVQDNFILKENPLLRRKVNDDKEKTKKRIPMKIYVRDENEIPNLRARVKELEKMEVMYKRRIEELEQQINMLPAMMQSNSHFNTLPIPSSNRSLYEGHKRDTITIPISGESSGDDLYSRFPNIVKSASDRTRLLALYDYTPAPEAKGRLAFREGEVLYLVNMKSKSGWWTAEINGKVGKIPSNYVEQLDPSKAFKVRITKNFDQQQFGDLSVLRGQLVTVLKRQDNGWYLGEKGGKNGFFPNSHCERISTPHS